MENRPYGVIYKITNLVNGKVYIGQTIQEDPNIRFIQHVSHSKSNPGNMIVSKAIKKYGKTNFKFEVIDEAKCRKELNIREGLWIELFKSYQSEFGYNTSKFSNEGRIEFSEETKLKMSIAAQKRSHIIAERNRKNRGKPRSNTTSKYLGVYKMKQRWASTIRIDNTQVHLGCFAKEEEAAIARDIKEIELFKDNASLNFPENKDKYLNGEINIKRIKPITGESKVLGVSKKGDKRWRVRLSGFPNRYFDHQQDAEDYATSCLKIRCKSS